VIINVASRAGTRGRPDSPPPTRHQGRTGLVGPAPGPPNTDPPASASRHLTRTRLQQHQRSQTRTVRCLGKDHTTRSGWRSAGDRLRPSAFWLLPARRTSPAPTSPSTGAAPPPNNTTDQTRHHQIISVLAISFDAPGTPAHSRSSGPRPCTAASTTDGHRDFAVHRRRHQQSARAIPDVSQCARGQNRQEPACTLTCRPPTLRPKPTRLISLGAKQIRSLGENNNRWISFIDPEGNEVDLAPADHYPCSLGHRVLVLGVVINCSMATDVSRP